MGSNHQFCGGQKRFAGEIQGQSHQNAGHQHRAEAGSKGQRDDNRPPGAWFHAISEYIVADNGGKRHVQGVHAEGCYSAKLEEIEKNSFVLTPGRYVGIEDEEDDGIPFEDKMESLTKELSQQFSESQRIEKTIRKNLEELGYGL